MTETEEKKLSPLETYAKLVDQLLGEKILPSSLRTSYPGSDFHPLQSFHQLKSQLDRRDFSEKHPAQESFEDVATVDLGKKDEKELTRASTSESLTAITSSATRQTTPLQDEISRMTIGREITKVTSIIRTKLEQYSGLTESAFQEDTVESLSTIQTSRKAEEVQSSGPTEVVPVTVNRKEKNEKDLENLFDEALSDLSGLFEKKKKRW